MKPVQAWTVNLTLSVVAVVLFLAALELILRSASLISNRGSFEQVIRSLPRVERGMKAALGNIIQPSLDRRIIYELRPNLRADFYGTVRTNGQGWRHDTDFSAAKPAGTIRIVGVGDSFMFGQGVEQGQNALSVLEGLLNARYPEKKWEVINTAVPGYNTVMEVETLKRKALRFQPDMVIIEYVLNDMDLPNFISVPVDVLDLKRSFLADFIARRLERPVQAFRLFDAPHHSGNGGRFEYDPSRVPAQYRDLVGWEAYEKALRELKSLAEENHFQVIALITFRDGKVLELNRELGFLTAINVAYNQADKAVVLADMHPSAVGHQRTAAVLFDFLARQGLIERYLR